METKELKIQIPKGYEIDKENSTFECIKSKPINRYVTYKDICKNNFNNEKIYYIEPFGQVQLNKKQLERALALNQFIKIAEYYNRINDSKEYWKYYIKHTTNAGYKVYCHNKYFEINEIYPFFNKKEDAQAVIDNPNFREILDIVYKDC